MKGVIYYYREQIAHRLGWAPDAEDNQDTEQDEKKPAENDSEKFDASPAA